MNKLRIILSALLVLALLPVSANAVSYDEAVTPKYEQIGAFSEGMAVVLLDGTYGFVDKTGKEIIAPIYDYASAFSEGLAVVERNGKCGAIDTNGNVAVPFEYEYINPFSEGLAAAYQGDKCGFIDKTGNEIIPCTYDDDLSGFRNGIAAVAKGEKWGFIDKTGKEITPFKYDKVRDFKEGMAAVCVYNESTSESLWGFINTDGTEVTGLIYNIAADFSEGFAAVELYEITADEFKIKCGFIDNSGKEVIKPSFFEVTDFSNGMALALESSYVTDSYTALYAISADGSIIKLGTDVTKFDKVFYEEAYDGVFLFAPFTEGYNYFAVDKTGNIVAEYIYISPFDNGIAVAIDVKYGNDGEPYLLPGIIDTQGNFTELLYDDMSLYPREGMLGVLKGGKWGFVSLSAAPAAPKPPALAPAKPSTQRVMVDGKLVDPDRYSINGNNYFKLRDIAHLLSGTDFQFEVGYENETVIVTTGKLYTPNGFEMGGKSTSGTTAVLTSDKVSLNGEPVTLTVYKINGSNYFKLRDVGNAIGFGVDYDEATQTVIVTTNTNLN